MYLKTDKGEDLFLMAWHKTNDAWPNAELLTWKQVMDHVARLKDENTKSFKRVIIEKTIDEEKQTVSIVYVTNQIGCGSEYMTKLLVNRAHYFG